MNRTTQYNKQVEKEITIEYINKLDDLDDLKYMLDLIKSRRRALARLNAYGFVKGDKVKIIGSGKMQKGIIEKVNRTRAVVIVDNRGWNVPFEMLRKDESVSLDDLTSLAGKIIDGPSE